MLLRTWVPLPPKLRRKRTACPVAASYSAAKRCVMRSYALRVTAKDTSVRLTVGSFFGGSCGFLLSLLSSSATYTDMNPLASQIPVGHFSNMSQQVDHQHTSELWKWGPQFKL